MARSAGARVLVLHGPNLNLLGTREPAVYGTTTLARLDREIQRHAAGRGAEAVCRQSNPEGQLIDWLHGAARERFASTVLHPGPLHGYSLALPGAARSAALPDP